MGGQTIHLNLRVKSALILVVCWSDPVIQKYFQLNLYCSIHIKDRCAIEKGWKAAFMKAIVCFYNLLNEPYEHHANIVLVLVWSQFVFNREKAHSLFCSYWKNSGSIRGLFANKITLELIQYNLYKFTFQITLDCFIFILESVKTPRPGSIFLAAVWETEQLMIF